MNEVQRLEYIQTYKSLKDMGCFSQEEFDLLKRKIICDNPETFQASLGDIKSAKDLVDNNTITNDEFDLIKIDFFSNREIVDLQTIVEYKGLLDRHLINDNEFTYLKSMLFSGTRKKVKIDELQALKNCALSGALSDAEYDQLRAASLSGAKIPKPIQFTKLNNYYKLCEDPRAILSYEEYLPIKSCILNGDGLPALEEFEKLNEYMKLLDEGAINQNDYEQRKNEVLSRVSATSYQIPSVNKEIISPNYKNSKEKMYKEALEKIQLQTSQGYRDAAAIFEILGNYNNSRELLKECKEIIPDVEENESQQRIPVRKKGKNGKKIAICVSALVVVMIIVAAASYLIPRGRAVKAHNAYVSSFDDLINSGEYQTAIDSANSILKEHERVLSDEEIEVLNSRIAYANAIRELNLTDNTPSTRIDISDAKQNLEDSMGYGISDELLAFYNEKGVTYDGYISGTLTVDHSEYKESKDESMSVDGTAYERGGVITFERGGLSSKASVNCIRTSGSVRYVPEGAKGKADFGSLNGDSENEKKEDKPVVNEYKCDGFITTGFKLIDKNKGIDTDNIEMITVLHADVSGIPEEKVSTMFDSVFKADDSNNIVITGTGDASVEKESSFEDGTVIADLGNGTTLALKVGGFENETTNDSDDYSDSSSSSSSGYSNKNPQDYS